MWIVFKYKKKEYHLLTQELKKRLGNLAKFYNPKIAYRKNLKNKKKNIEDYFLKDYAFCYFENFKDKNFVSRLNNCKGLQYFLNGYSEQQKQIAEFIDMCKKHEDDCGYIKNSFFSNLNFSRIKFLNGPFSNLIFQVLERTAGKLEISLGKLKLSVGKKSNYIYSPIY